MRFAIRSSGRWKAVATLALLPWLASCGGGGGGSDGGANPSGGSFSVSLDKTRIAFDLVEGTASYAVSPQEILATAQGTLPDALYVLATVDGPGLNPNIPTLISNEGARFRVWPADGLAAGSYTGKLNLYACADEACKQPIGGTPKQVDYSVKVHHRLAAQAPEGLTVVSGQSVTFNLPVTVPDNATGFTAQVGEASRLVLGSPSGNTLPVTIGGPLKSGVYTDWVTLTCSGSCKQTGGLAITYEVKPPPGGEHGLLVSSSSLTFASTEGDTPPGQTVQVELPTWGGGQRAQLRYELNDPVTWLQARATPSGVTVTASAAGLKAGTYTSSVYVVEPATGLTQNLYVSFTVGVGLVQPANLSVKLLADSRQKDFQWQVPIRLNGGPDVAYVASSDQPWLLLPQASGTTGQSLSVEVDPVALRQQVGDSGRAFGTVVLRPTSSTHSPVQFTVVADVKLPRLDIVAPQVLLADQAQTVRLRGAGLADVTRLNELLRVDGQTLPASIVRAGDAFVLSLPALAAGSHELKLATDTGVAIAPLTLRTVAPLSLPFSAMTAVSAPGTLFYDDWRRALYTLDANGQALWRHSWSGRGARWTATRYPQAVQAAGPTPRGDQWMVVTTTGDLSLVDADTFVVQQGPFNWSVGNTFWRPWGPIRYRGNGVATYRTEQGGLLGGGVGGIDLISLGLTGTLSTPLLSNDLKAYALPHLDMQVSADGERALFYRPDGFYGPVIYLSPSLGEPMRQVTGFTDQIAAPDVLLAMSVQGDRTLTATQSYGSLDSLQALTVWNRDFTEGHDLMWRDPGGSHQVVGAALSPDGRRAYVITHPQMSDAPQVAYLHVFDTGSSLPSGQMLTALGDTELPTLADCAGAACAGSTWPHLQMQVSLDGKTLFVSGRSKLMVLPLPAEDTLSAANATRVRAASVRATTPKTVRWR